MTPTTYTDHGTTYLELHARRAPLGPYVGEFSEENDPKGYGYNSAVENAVQEFALEHDVELYLLGRSGQHVCIDDTPQNRKRYTRLQKAANDAADALWAMMRGKAV